VSPFAERPSSGWGLDCWDAVSLERDALPAPVRACWARGQEPRVSFGPWPVLVHWREALTGLHTEQLLRWAGSVSCFPPEFSAPPFLQLIPARLRGASLTDHPLSPSKRFNRLRGASLLKLVLCGFEHEEGRLQWSRQQELFHQWTSHPWPCSREAGIAPLCGECYRLQMLLSMLCTRPVD
jgi:hypothetical protein